MPRGLAKTESGVQPVIRVKDLVAGYGDNVVLDGVSIEIESGEILVVMGQSGCGKSTFLRHVIGLQQPLGGTVEVNGRDMSSISRSQYRDFCRTVGVLFQSSGLFNSMTVGENVAFPLREHTQVAEPVIDIVVGLKLQQVGLPDVAGKMPGELSGGMKRRAGLARALALDPAILFLDEPTSGLDPIIAAGIDDLVLYLRKLYGATMVVISHDIASGMRVADRIAILRDKKIVALGTPEEIKNSDNSYVQQFLNRESDSEVSNRLQQSLLGG